MCSLFAVVAGCGDDSAVIPPDACVSELCLGNVQTPATGPNAIESWLAAGFYKSWSCEAAVHAGRAPTPHGFNRVCSNTVLSQSIAGNADWPVGAAAVKELFTSATATTPVGYAVYVKQASDSAGGDNWYWYERTPEGVVADSSGRGAAKTACVSCHIAAGTDAAHTPSPGGRDLVYTPVPPQ